ncbi:hypothetical protein [Variovorax sp. Root411]|uniref:hypothetical protein n=1 Tax=Variovorax sp. Root411 TaxID=1736530 RepID=UPI000A98BE0F|nr:hypothetical protein [Variovorax sp. Root411]
MKLADNGFTQASAAFTMTQTRTAGSGLELTGLVRDPAYSGPPSTQKILGTGAVFTAIARKPKE